MGCANSIDQPISAPSRQQSISLSQQHLANSRPHQFMNIHIRFSQPASSIPQEKVEQEPDEEDFSGRQQGIKYPDKHHFDLVKAERVEFSCFEGHAMFRVPDLKSLYSGTYYKENLYYCNFCGSTKDCTNDPSIHCSKCEFDLCPKCFEEQKDIEFTCVSGHRLFKVPSLIACHLGKSYKSGRYICSCCGRILQAKEDPTYHCPHCEFDMCPLCARQQQKSDCRCPTGHNLFRVTDLRRFNQGNAYKNNLYSCNVCKNILQAEEHPVAYCSLCKFSACPECVKADKMSSKNKGLKRNNSFGNDREETKVVEQVEIKENCEKNLNNNEILDTKMACLICLKDFRSYIFDPCKHLCACESCSWTLVKDERPCPICRKQIKNVTKIFIA